MVNAVESNAAAIDLANGKLSDLQENNPEFTRYKKEFEDKLKVSAPFKTKDEFIEEELVRIKTSFVKAVTMTMNGGDFKIVGQFNFTEYTQQAYDWLSAGRDWPLKNILANAKMAYLQSSPNRQMGDEELFTKSIIHCLQEGVGLLQYEQYLKTQKAASSAKAGSGIKRKPIPQKIKAKLQQEINSTCPFCGNKDADHFEVHHIDEKRDNNVFGNLLMLCPLCHSKITKGDISVEEVVEKKLSLSGNVLPASMQLGYTNEKIFGTQLNKVLAYKDSAYYSELKANWTSYSLVSGAVFLESLMVEHLAEAINLGLFPVISDFTRKHLHFDQADKYNYTQPHLHLHNKEEEGYNFPVYYHIRFIGILYQTAIENGIDIQSLPGRQHSMLSIYSAMVEVMVNNIVVSNGNERKPYPTNYHWLIGEIFDTLHHWLIALNDHEVLVEKSSYLYYIPANMQLCLQQLYAAEKSGKVSVDFIAGLCYYHFLSEYFSPEIGPALKESIEKNVLAKMPHEYLVPILTLALNDGLNIEYDEFLRSNFDNNSDGEIVVLKRLRTFLLANKQI